MAYYNYSDFIFVNFSYAIITFFVVTFYLILLPKIGFNKYQKVELNYFNVLLFSIILTSTLGCLFFIFKVIFGFYEFCFERVATGTLALLSIISVFVIVYVIINQIQKNRLKPIEVLISNKQNAINVNDVLYIYSDKNYVVWVCEVNNRIVEYRERETLKSVVERLDYQNKLTQCHRAFVVNKSRILKIKKVQNSYQIIFHEVNDVIILSKRFKSKFQHFI